MQVFQRDGNGRATIPIVLDEAVKDVTVVDAVVLNGGMGGTTFTNAETADRARFVDGKLVGVPVGGPYTIRLTLKDEKSPRRRCRTRSSARSSSATSGCWPGSRTWKGWAT